MVISSQFEKEKSAASLAQEAETLLARSLAGSKHLRVRTKSCRHDCSRRRRIVHEWKRKMKFVLINHSILDFGEFGKDFGNHVASFSIELRELADKYGLKLEKVRNYSDFRKKAVFYNPQLDMELVVTIRKKSPPEFV